MYAWSPDADPAPVKSERMNKMDYLYSSATRLALDIRERRIGCRELLELYLSRLEKINPEINAIVVLDLLAARNRADKADAALACGELWGPLHGLPITVKESYNIEGLPTTRGIPGLATNVAKSDMSLVQRLKKAGAVIFGKSNVPIHLADWQSYNAIYGSTSNPWDKNRTPGGSSGGGAAAVAAGLVAFEAGSDSAGSLRVPAHYCGVYGHRPTYGIVSQLGHELGGRRAPRDLSTLGPLARSAEDLELLLSVMGGPDQTDARGLSLSLPRPTRRKFSEFRIAVMLDCNISRVDAEVRGKIREVADFLTAKGAKIEEAKPGLDPEQTTSAFLKLLRSAGSSGLPPAAVTAARDLVGGAPKDLLDYRTESARAEIMEHRDWLAIDDLRHALRQTWFEFFDEWDLLICPASSTPAVPHDHVSQRWEQKIVVDGETFAATDQMFWVGFSALALLPSTVVPIGTSSTGLPIGMQIIGSGMDDFLCIELAKMLERSYRRFEAPPGYI
jgi:amidase